MFAPQRLFSYDLPFSRYTGCKVNLAPKILKFPDINFLQTALFMFKVDRNLLPSHLIKSFYQNSEIHHYCTRSSDNYHLESVNTNIKRFSINHKGPILWNSIPPSIRALSNINQFKRHVIDTLLKKY